MATTVDSSAPSAPSGMGAARTSPRHVALNAVERELNAGRRQEQEGMPLLRACTLTLVVLCDRNEEPEMLEELIGEIVASNPARVVLIAQTVVEGLAGLDARVATYLRQATDGERVVGEEVALYPRGAQGATLASAALALRVSGLPFVLYWRGQPDLEDPLFRALVGECDQILFDSQHFTARAERINNTIARLRIDYPSVSFGDVNWQRIRPWRELVARFFDDPANLTYLDEIRRVEIEFSVGRGGNQSAAVLLMAWLASALGWRVVNGSYEREGITRRARFERRDYGATQMTEVQVLIQVREQSDCMPGELTGVRLDMGDEPPEAVFKAKRAEGGFVDVQELTPQRFGERFQRLNVPPESSVVTSELDAPRNDRNYHRALELLDDLVSPNLDSPLLNF